MRRRAATVFTASFGAMAVIFGALALQSTAEGAAGSIVLCAQVGSRDGETRETAIANLEAKIGRKIAAHKDFFKWDDTFPASQQLDDAKKGRAPAINWIAKRRGGSNVPWRSIASGMEDAQIKRWAGYIKAYGRHVYLTFHHEPENDGVHGTAADFVAAFRHVRSVFEQQGVTNVTWVVALMAITFNEGDPNMWYPGDRYVDLLGLNGYNWYPGKPGSVWRSLSEIYQTAYKWGAARGKPMMITETGVQEDPNWTSGNRKAQWFLNALSTMKGWPLLKVFCYWHNRASYCDACRWWIDTSTASLDAFRRIANDPYMGGSGSPAPSPTASPSPTSGGDSTPPTVTAPLHSIAANSTIGSGVPVDLSWSGSDAGSGVARYKLQQSTNGGSSYADVSLPSAKTTSVTRSLSAGTNLYRFRVRAADSAGNWSAWSEGPAFKVVPHQESSGAIGYTGNWRDAKRTSAYGGAVSWAKTGGDRAVMTFSGTGVSWVAPKDMGMGKAEVWVDGRGVALIDLYSATSVSRRVVFARSLLPGSHTLEIRVLGKRNAQSKGTEVDVDAFVVLT